MAIGLEAQEQQRIIDGVTYRVWPLPFTRGRRVLQRLLKVLGPIIAAGGLAESKFEQGAAVLGALPDALSETELDFLENTFADQSHYLAPNGSEWIALASGANRDLHFAARYHAYVAWLIFSIEVNFACLFRGGVIKQAAESLATLVAPKKEAPATPST